MYTPPTPPNSPPVNTSIHHNDNVTDGKRSGKVLGIVDMKLGDSLGMGDLKMFPPLTNPNLVGRYYLVKWVGKSWPEVTHYLNIKKA